MHMEPPFTVAANAARDLARDPVISVLVPFYDTDPVGLVHSLLSRAEALGGGVELIVADDGSSDSRHSRAVTPILQASSAPAALITAAYNLGRAKIRNVLAAAGRGEYVLFIDSDLRPGAPDFLERYLQICKAASPDVVYGGFEMVPDGTNPDPLDAYYARHSDCVPAEQRRADPAKHTFTNNLLVRRAVMLGTPFDERFTGWGWEDVEWALRVSEHRTIEHIDNPVLNPATSSAAALVAKFGGSAGNFQLLLQRHPELAARYPIYRASRVMRMVPFAGALQPLFRRIALDRSGLWPVRARYYALKLYRAVVYRTVEAPAGDAAARRDTQFT